MAVEHEDGVITIVETKKGLKPPSMYKVLLHNDHYTTRDFVVELLKTVFHKNEADAVQIMLHVHTKGVGIAGLYPYEIAETKVRTAEALAKKHEFPLRLSMEPN